jgi:predicted N-formylglutamate amidohydrolase
VHGEKRALINPGIEFRQDLNTEDSGQREWAARLVRILQKLQVELLALI